MKLATSKKAGGQIVQYQMKLSNLPLPIVALFALTALISCQKNIRRSVPEIDEHAAADFHERIEDYERIHRHAARGLPHFHLEMESANIVERQQSLAKNIQALRQQAKEGDIFTPAITAYFSREIGAAYEENGDAIRATLQLDKGASQRHVQVNHPYPESNPYTIMPPTLLARLPQLPQILEYRIIHRDLLLRDVESNLVVDIARRVIPD